MDTTLLFILVPIIVAVISSYLTYFFAIKSKKNKAILKFKEEKYSNLLILLLDFVGKTTSDASKILINSEDGKFLLGRGDMLLKSGDSQELKRIQAPLISDKEMLKINGFINTTS